MQFSADSIPHPQTKSKIAINELYSNYPEKSRNVLHISKSFTTYAELGNHNRIKDTEYVQISFSCWKSEFCCLFNILHMHEFCFQPWYGRVLNLIIFKKLR